MNAPVVPPPRQYRPAGHPCDKLCREATGPANTCSCACGGSRHGVARPTQEVALAAALGRIGADPFARLPVTADDDAF